MLFFVFRLPSTVDPIVGSEDWDAHRDRLLYEGTPAARVRTGAFARLLEAS